MPNPVSHGEILEHFDEVQQQQVGLLRAALSAELDRWEMERRHFLQHPQAQQYALQDEKLEITLECDWFYIYSANPPVDHFTYYRMEDGAGRLSIIPRNVKRYGPVRKGIVILPIPGYSRIEFWIVWGIGTKDSNLSFEYRQADETFAPQQHREQLLVPGPNAPLFNEDNARISVCITPLSGGFPVFFTDATGIPVGAILPAGTVTWIDLKASSDTIYLGVTGGAAVVNATGFYVSRELPNV